MSRAARRHPERGYVDLPGDFRRSQAAQYRAAKAAAAPTPEVNVSEEQLRVAGIVAKDGDKITLQGFQSQRVNGVVRIVRDCKPGDETPFIVRVKS